MGIKWEAAFTTNFPPGFSHLHREGKKREKEKANFIRHETIIILATVCDDRYLDAVLSRPMHMAH